MGTAGPLDGVVLRPYGGADAQPIRQHAQGTWATDEAAGGETLGDRTPVDIYVRDGNCYRLYHWADPPGP
jgi:hypothetical protein